MPGTLPIDMALQGSHWQGLPLPVVLIVLIKQSVRLLLKLSEIATAADQSANTEQEGLALVR